MNHKQTPQKLGSLLKDSRVQLGIVLFALILILYLSVTVRVSNESLLIDRTNGNSIPLALDPFYFMRVAQTYIENGGSMPEYDALRYNPVEKTPWHHEIHPYIVANLFSIYSQFDDTITLERFYVLSPVMFFVIGLLLFFGVCYLLTKDKWIALLSTGFLAFIPAYLYRTMAGFADHESVGMMAFFLTCAVYILSLYNIGRKKDSYIKSIFFGLLVGFATALTYYLWSGVLRFIVLIFPPSIFLIWIFNTRKKNLHIMHSLITFYGLWIFSTIIFGYFFNNRYLQNVISLFTSSEGIISIVVLAFMCVDYIFITKKFEFVKQKFRVIYSLIATAIAGIIGLIVTGRNPFSYLFSISQRLLKPLGYGRVGSTVAENQSPYLHQWVAQSGEVIFWNYPIWISTNKKDRTEKTKIHAISVLRTYDIWGYIL